VSSDSRNAITKAKIFLSNIAETSPIIERVVKQMLSDNITEVAKFGARIYDLNKEGKYLNNI